jgi:hypothetical protein
MFILTDFEDCLIYIINNIELNLEKFKENKKYQIQIHIFNYLIKNYDLEKNFNDIEIYKIINCLYEIFYDDIHKKLLKNQELNQYYNDYYNDYFNSYNIILIDDYCSYLNY